MYRGFWSAFWRDVPNWGVYFVTYLWFKNTWNSFNLDNWSEKKKNICSKLWLINAGGVAGVASWIGSMPFDIIKTRQQTYARNEFLTMREIAL